MWVRLGWNVGDCVGVCGLGVDEVWGGWVSCGQNLGEVWKRRGTVRLKMSLQ